MLAFDLAGLGGILNSGNLGVYTYGHQNPLKFVDPDGRVIFGAVVKLLEKGGEKLVRHVGSKAEALQARQAGENVVFKSKQQARQVEEANAGGDKSTVLRHKGHELRDGSTGRPHYQTEGKKGHSMWGKLPEVAVGVSVGTAVGVNSNEAEASDSAGNQGSGSNITLKDVGEFLIDIFIGVNNAGDANHGDMIQPISPVAE